MEIRTRGSTALIETATNEGTRLRAYDGAEALQAGMERDGMNAFLEAQERSTAAVLDAALDALGPNRTGTIILIEPAPLAHERDEVPPIEWTPHHRQGDAGDEKVGAGNAAPEPERPRSATAGATVPSEGQSARRRSATCYLEETR